MGDRGPASEGARGTTPRDQGSVLAWAVQQSFLNRVLVLSVATALVVVASKFFRDYNPTPILVLYVAALALYGGLRLWFQRSPLSNARSLAVLALDMLAVSLFVYFTGALASPFAWVYVMLLFRTDILRGRTGTSVAFGGAVFLLWAQAWLIYLRVVPEFVLVPTTIDLHGSLPLMLIVLLGYTLALGVVLQIATFFQEARKRDSLRFSHMAAMRALISAAEARSPQTMGHGVRVTRYATAVAREMRVHPLNISTIQDAALVHDVGQALLPPEVAHQAGPLDPAQQAQVMSHPLVGVELLESTGALESLVPLVRHHHEWFDGTGYPDGLAGEAIPLGARILAVSDAYEALTAGGRSTPEQALEELERRAGSQFDPRAVQALRAAWQKAQVTVSQVTLAEPSHPGTGRPLAEVALPWSLGMRPSTQQKAAAALLRIGQQTGLIRDVDALGPRLMGIVRDVLPYDAGVFLSHPDTVGPAVRWGVGHWAGWADKPLTPREGPVAHALGTGDIALLPDTHDVPAFVEEGFAGGAALLVPLRGSSMNLGLLVLERERPGSFTQEELRLMQALAPHLTMLLEVAVLHRQTAEAAVTDALTGLHNYRYFSQRLEEEIARSRRSQAPLTLVILDVDHLKQVNDTHGHLAGDAVLRAVGAALRQNVRASDVVARYGGDEFAVILPEAGREDAEAVMGRGVAAFGARPVPLPSSGDTLPPPGLCWGLATYPADGEDATALFATADKALYEQKRGRSPASP